MLNNISHQEQSSTSSTPENQQQEQFDYIDKEIDENLICSICSLPFIDPISHNSCGNTFCSKCVDSVASCPNCSEVDFKKNCAPSVKTIRNLLDKLKVKCSMCKNIVLRGELKDHQNNNCPLQEAYKQVEELMKKLEQEFTQKQDESQRKHLEMMNNLQQERERLHHQVEETLSKKEQILLNQHKEKENLLNSKIKEYETLILTIEKLENSNKPIHLNIRGKIMTCSLGDFIHNEREPENLFKKMFKGEHPCYRTGSKQFEDTVYYIDCDPVVFKHLLEWLKFGSVGNELSSDLRQSLLNSSILFEMSNLASHLTSISKNAKQLTQISQFDFMNIVNFSTLQKTTLNLSGLDLRKLVLNSANLENSEIMESNFSGMNLRQTNFKGSNLRGCNFSNCNLSSVKFQDCDLGECNFSNAILNKSVLWNAKLSDANFEKAKLENSDFSNANLLNSKFVDASIQGTKFIGAKFENVSGLQNRKLDNFDFSNSNFKSITFNDSDLSNAKFTNCTFISCNLENTILSKTNFKSALFINCLFNNKCKFDETIFKETSLKDVRGLTDININKVDFSNSKLINTAIIIDEMDENSFLSNLGVKNISFTQKLLSNVDFTNRTLSHIDFSGFKFENVNFTNTIIEGTKFESASFVKCKIQVHFKKKNHLNDVRFLECNLSGTIFEEIDYKLIESIISDNNLWNSFTIKNSDLRELKDLSTTFGLKFDSCLRNSPNKTPITSSPIMTQSSHECLVNEEETDEAIDANQFGVLSSNIIKECGISISKELYSHTNGRTIPQLIYRATRDGFKAIDFHSKCDYLGATLILIRSENNQIFGAFTSKSFQSPQKSIYVSDEHAFLFKIEKDSNSEEFTLRKFNVKQEKKDFALFLDRDYLPTFGSGCDIHISSDCNLNNDSYSNLGETFELPTGLKYESLEAQRYLGGSNNFRVREIEVFSISNK